MFSKIFCFLFFIFMPCLCFAGKGLVVLGCYPKDGLYTPTTCSKDTFPTPTYHFPNVEGSITMVIYGAVDCETGDPVPYQQCVATGGECPSEAPESEQCPDCTDEYEDMSRVCGNSEKVIIVDADTCEMRCDCSEEAEALEEECSPYGVVGWDDITCTGECDSCPYQAEMCEQSCGGADNVENYFCFDTGNGVNVECECAEPPDDTCEDRYQSCADSCGGHENVALFTCDSGDDGGVTSSECKCKTPDRPPPPGPGNPDDPDPSNPSDGDGDGDGDGYDPDSDDHPDDTPTPDPSDPDDDSGYLSAIKSDLAVLVKQNNDRKNQLRDLNKNVYAIAVGQDGVKEEVRYVADSLNHQAGKIISAIEGLEGTIAGPDSVVIDTYGGDLGEDNVYDVTVVDVAEDDLGLAITSYIESGLPFLNFIKNSYLETSAESSAMSVSLWGGDVSFDFAPMESVLNWMGFVLLSVCSIFGFMIVVRG